VGFRIKNVFWVILKKERRLKFLMKNFTKILAFILIFTFLTVFSFPKIAKADVDLAPQSKSAILIDAVSGQVLFEKNKEEKLAPASVTKIMTLLLIMEALEDGRLKLDEVLTASPEACRMGGSQIWLEPGEKMTAEDLIISVAVASANDSAYVLAERIAGSHDNFVKMMNEKAKELGMSNTNFVNCTGLDADEHYTTAEDIAKMSRELVKHKQILKWTSLYEYYIRNGESWLVNTNKLVRFYEGCDGLKTGSTSKAGFCLSATAVKDGMRLIAVVMNAPSSKIRNAEISQMLNYGFANFTSQKIVDKGSIVEKISVEKGMTDQLALITADELQVVIPKTQKDEITIKTEKPEKITAPIQKGTKIGRLVAIKDGKEIASVDLVALEDIEKANFFKIFQQLLISAFK